MLEVAKMVVVVVVKVVLLVVVKVVLLWVWSKITIEQKKRLSQRVAAR